MGLIGLTMAAGGIIIFKLYGPLGFAKAQTMALTLLAVFQWYNSLNCRFTHKSILSRRIFGNKYIWLSLGMNLGLQVLAVHSVWFNRVLKTQPLALGEWVLVLVLGLSVIAVDEVRKLFIRLSRNP